jgi:uncharacterized membrane protein YqjE
MFIDLITATWTLLRVMSTRLRSATRQRLRPVAGEAGVSTLEMVIIALGLMAVAALLVAAITAAVTRRTNQIN